MKVLVTGGAGFIGSHLVDVLLDQGVPVRVVDNFSSGALENIEHHLKNPEFELLRGDLLDPNETIKAVRGCEIVFHLAANPEVRVSSVDPEIHYRQNILATYNLLEAVRRADVECLVFTSSSTVYGEARRIPTPEDYAPLEPISVYGASKLACEALISAYAHTYGFKAVIYRLANIIGPRSRHGVIHDFIVKLRKNPRELEILGDGTQTKSYLHVSDCVEAILTGIGGSQRRVETYNVGSEDQISVREIAEIVVREMGLRNVRFRFTGGVDGGRGWKGDVKNMLLDITKIRSLGWRPRYNSRQAVKEAARSLLAGLSARGLGS